MASRYFCCLVYLHHVNNLSICAWQSFSPSLAIILTVLQLCGTSDVLHSSCHLRPIASAFEEFSLCLYCSWWIEGVWTHKALRGQKRGFCKISKGVGKQQPTTVNVFSFLTFSQPAVWNGVNQQANIHGQMGSRRRGVKAKKEYEVKTWLGNIDYRIK